jgi:hypothetical protein
VKQHWALHPGSNTAQRVSEEKSCELISGALVSPPITIGQSNTKPSRFDAKISGLLPSTTTQGDVKKVADPNIFGDILKQKTQDDVYRQELVYAI